MTENIHNGIDKLFHDSIEPLTELPGGQVWDNIRQQVYKDNAEKYKRKYLLFKSIASVLLLLLLLAFGVFFTFDYNNPTITKTSLPNKDAPGYITSNTDNTTRNKNYQNGNVNSDFLNHKNKKELPIGKKRIVIIKNGNTTERDLSPGEDVQMTRVINTMEFYSTARTSTSDDIQFTRLQAIRSPDSKTTDSIKTNVKSLIKISNNKNDKIARRLFFTVFATPEISNYTLQDDEKNYYENKQIIQKREKHLFSYSAGILISYALNVKFTLQSGFTYSSSYINIDPNKIYAVKSNSSDVKFRYNTSSGYGYILPSFSSSPAIGDSLYTRTSVHTLQSISLPVIMRYNFRLKKFSLNPGIGIALNFLTKARLKTEVNDNTSSESEVITKLKGLKNINYSFLFIPELELQVSKRWGFTASPYLKYAITPINNGSVVKTFPYDLGLGFGLKHQL